jgi:hypothetical protein
MGPMWFLLHTYLAPPTLLFLPLPQQALCYLGSLSSAGAKLHSRGAWEVAAVAVHLGLFPVAWPV